MQSYFQFLQRLGSQPAIAAQLAIDTPDSTKMEEAVRFIKMTDLDPTVPPPAGVVLGSE